MKKFIKSTFICLGFNVVFFLLFFFSEIFGNGNDTWAVIAILLTGISLFAQFVVGFTLLLFQEKKIVGQAILFSIGILLLVGFSICGNGIK